MVHDSISTTFIIDLDLTVYKVVAETFDYIRFVIVKHNLANGGQATLLRDIFLFWKRLSNLWDLKLSSFWKRIVNKMFSRLSPTKIIIKRYDDVFVPSIDNYLWFRHPASSQSTIHYASDDIAVWTQLVLIQRKRRAAWDSARNNGSAGC